MLLARCPNPYACQANYVLTRRCRGGSRNWPTNAFEGRLTPEERDEYEAMIRVGNFVAILQAKARRLLAEGHAA
jgi:hypothetical protein